MLGMPVDAWVLLGFAIGLGLTLEVMFFVARRRGREGSAVEAGGDDAQGGASTDAGDAS